MHIQKDKELVDQLKLGNNSAYSDLYDTCFPIILAYVKKNSGNQEDAEDIFQESTIVLLQKIKEIDFVLISTVKTFLFSIAKNKWLKKIRDENKNVDLFENTLIEDLFELNHDEIVH